MPIQTEWYVPRRIMMTRFIGNVTIEEMRTDRTHSVRLCQDLTKPIITIVDATELIMLPLQISDLIEFWQEDSGIKASMTVIYGVRDEVTRLIANIFSHTIRREVRIVNSLKEALDIIAEFHTVNV